VHLRAAFAGCHTGGLLYFADDEENSAAQFGSNEVKLNCGNEKTSTALNLLVLPTLTLRFGNFNRVADDK
jgi:hypothetical protein